MRKLALILVLAMMVGCVRRRSQHEEVPTQTTPSCDVQKAISLLKAKHYGFIATASSQPDTIVLFKDLITNYGQHIGHETYVFSYNSSTAEDCVFENLFAERKVYGDRLVNLFTRQESHFYRNGQHVYTDRSLRDGWHRTYHDLGFVPVRVPNWATRSGESLYMTWVARSTTTASRVPVWGFEAIWQQDGRDFTLMAGRVILKNPETGQPTPDDVFTVLRVDEKGLVHKAGVLFPVSQKTFENYLSYLQGKTADWNRDLPSDEVRLAEFVEGPMKNTKAQQLPIAEVCARRGTVPTGLPEVKSGFEPSFNLLPQLH